MKEKDFTEMMVAKQDELYLTMKTMQADVILMSKQLDKYEQKFDLIYKVLLPILLALFGLAMSGKVMSLAGELVRVAKAWVLK